MTSRIALAAALLGALLLAVPAHAGPPTMDGKKVKVLTVTKTSGVEEHDKDLAGSASEPVECQPPRCVRLPFVYKPAKGTPGGLMFTATWTTPGTDVDLFVGEIDKRGRTTLVGDCASSGPPSERFYLGPSEVKSGKTYVLVLDFFRAVNEKVTGKVEIGVPSSVKTTMPAKAEDLKKVNCTL